MAAIRRGRVWRGAVLAAATALLAACATTNAPPPRAAGPVPGTMRPYAVNGVWYRPAYQPGYDAVGLASWYGPRGHATTTADGEVFDARLASAAHTTLPLPCIVEVTNLDNGRRTRVRVNDRGPFVAGRIIDLSPAAASEIGLTSLARVRVRFIGPAPPADRPTPAPWQALPTPSPAKITVAWRIQAGAFADRANAERAAALLAGAGRASIEPLSRGGAILFRVFVAGEGPADAARARVAALGFPGARVIDPS